ncbi:MAG: tetratricopeptide repeat protein [Alphaproteobacteria bacterium]|nr:tetratricopeptide repeat protein [Alphaproteobacteria bacterium]MCB9697239.1 tetratricopeptide repeat protein [Alphaproteobacteria bacterium]
MDRIDAFRALLEKKPDDRFALYSLAFELKKAGRAEEALTAFGELLRRHPTSGAGHLQLGMLLQDLGRDDDAREAWEAGLGALAGCEDPEARRSVGEIQAALDAS